MAGAARGGAAWYEPHLERLHEDHAVRRDDLLQLEQIAAGYPSRERFLTELTLDPPSATSDLAGGSHGDEDHLILSTIHSAKGQEWQQVFVLNCVDGCIPSDRSTGTRAHNRARPNPGGAACPSTQRSRRPSASPRSRRRAGPRRAHRVLAPDVRRHRRRGRCSRSPSSASPPPTSRPRSQTYWSLLAIVFGLICLGLDWVHEPRGTALVEGRAQDRAALVRRAAGDRARLRADRRRPAHQRRHRPDERHHPRPRHLHLGRAHQLAGRGDRRRPRPRHRRRRLRRAVPLDPVRPRARRARRHRRRRPDARPRAGGGVDRSARRQAAPGSGPVRTSRSRRTAGRWCGRST